MSRGERPRYCDADYWEQRYVERPDNFEWYYTYEDIMPTARFVFKPGQAVLCVGNGNSNFPVKLHQDAELKLGQIVAADISRVVTEQMKKEHQGYERLQFHVDDVSKMQYGDGQFDVVFDKGCLDALATGATLETVVPKLVSEAHRVLRKGGVYLLLSGGQPYKRVDLFPQDQWTINIKKMPETDYNDEDYFMYFCWKL